MQLDTDIYNNKKIVKLETKHGPLGFSFGVKLMCRIFADGYYLKLDDDEIAMLCKKVVYVSPEEFDILLEAAFEVKLFDRGKFENHKILTSYGIQKKYFDIGKDKRWQRLLVVSQYISSRINLKEYSYFTCDTEGSIISEYRKGVKVPENERRRFKEEEIKTEPEIDNSESLDAEEPVIKYFTYGDVLSFIKIPFGDRDKDFKKYYSVEEYQEYVDINLKINQKYEGIRFSKCQLTLPEYIEITNQISPKPSLNQIERAFREIAEFGVQDTTDIYLRLDSCLGKIINCDQAIAVDVPDKPPVKKLNGYHPVELPIPMLDLYQDDQLSKDVLSFFGFNQLNHARHYKTFAQFMTVMNTNSSLDLFRNYFKAYKELKSIDGGKKFKHSFENYIGHQDQKFIDGKWDDENWELKLKESKVPDKKINGQEPASKAAQAVKSHDDFMKNYKR